MPPKQQDEKGDKEPTWWNRYLRNSRTNVRCIFNKVRRSNKDKSAYTQSRKKSEGVTAAACQPCPNRLNSKMFFQKTTVVNWEDWDFGRSPSEKPANEVLRELFRIHFSNAMNEIDTDWDPANHQTSKNRTYSVHKKEEFRWFQNLVKTKCVGVNVPQEIFTDM